MSEQHVFIYPVEGIRLGTTCAGIKVPDRRDLVIIALAEGSTVAGVFTQNAFCAAPVQLAKQHLKIDNPAYLVINTGNANAGTGEQGLQDAEKTCQALAKIANCSTQQVLPFSTGVIGEPLPVEKILQGLTQAYQQLSVDAWNDAAWGILTTDTVAKGSSRCFQMGEQAITVTGIAKGSGMIRPDMATMLAFITTDAPIAKATLQAMLHYAVNKSFNRITVDGDTSTNDACILVATGKADIAEITDIESTNGQLLLQHIVAVAEDLAKAIIKDGEGATKLVTIAIEQGQTEQECLQVAYTIAHSPLVKTALFASDPNWGRILAAVGRAGLKDLDINGLEIYLDEVCIVQEGGRAKTYQEADAQEIMYKNDMTITVKLARGEAQTKIWTCDFSYDYVKINAEYRT